MMCIVEHAGNAGSENVIEWVSRLRVTVILASWVALSVVRKMLSISNVAIESCFRRLAHPLRSR